MATVPARGTLSNALLDVIRTRYGRGSLRPHAALEDSINLNVVVRDGERLLVLRAYRSWMTPPRLAAVQRIRQFLIESGLPFAPLCRTLDGRGWCEVGDQLVELEEFVPSESYLRTFTHNRLAMPVLAQIHDRLAVLMDRRDTSPPYLPRIDEPDPAELLTAATAAPPAANHVDAAQVVDVVGAGADAVRGAGLAPRVTRHAAVAETLAGRLWELEAATVDQLPRQLVHGDFWDDNVRFRGDRVVLVTDLDFMGYRPRIDDLALTLFYANERLGRDDRSARRVDQLRQLVDAYDGALRSRLTGVERRALPYAIARTSLCFMRHLPHCDTASIVRVVDRRGPAWAWALQAIDDPAWVNAFA